MRALLLVACVDAQVRFTCDVAKEVAKYRNLQNLKLLFDGRRVGNATLGPLMRKTGSTTMQRFGPPQSAGAPRITEYEHRGVRAVDRRFASGYQVRAL